MCKLTKNRIGRHVWISPSTLRNTQLHAPLSLDSMGSWYNPEKRKSLAQGLAGLQLFQQTQLSGIY